ncbi:MAG: hypothetical protein KF782_02535 [Labilithrix sp.]|nr:hypothetical protein [Labilithrix sp.]
MPPARLVLRVLLRGAVGFAPVAAAAACSDGAGDAVPAGDAGDEAADAAREAGADAGGGERPTTTCGITRAYFEGCGNDGDLNCGADGFDAWCAANDAAINSEAYRRAEALCLTDGNCDGAKRRACEYAHYNDETPTAAQRALVAAYCETCAPSDVAGCEARSTTYDPAEGIEGVDDIFVAAWELADAIVDEMRTECTGAAAAPDAGGDLAACAKAFAGCAAEVYLDRLPDCPK